MIRSQTRLAYVWDGALEERSYCVSLGLIEGMNLKERGPLAVVWD